MTSALENYINRTVAVITSDGRMIVGTLKGFDQTINLILDESHERVFSSSQGVEQVVLGLYIVRGDNVGKRKTDDSHSHSSEVPISLAKTAPPSLSIGGGYHPRDKHLKKLHKAATTGNEQKLKDYLERKKYNVNGRDKRSRTPLHLACANGYTNIVSLLIENQCKINVQDSENRTPLIKQAVQCQQESCATVLLLHGADPNLVDVYSNTALHYAVCGQNISLANKLLQYKANLEAKNKDGHTPLLLAVAENNENMVKFLLKKGADVNASDKNHRDRGGPIFE